MSQPLNVVTLLPATNIGTSDVGAEYDGLHRYKGFFGTLNLTAKPTGGTPTLDVYVQASGDGGTTWRDMAHYQFTTTLGARHFQLSQLAAGGTATLAASDAALAGDTVVQGPFGDRLRVKYVFAAGASTGTYTLTVTGVPVGPP